MVKRIRDWLFTPMGAAVYFGVGYGALGVWIMF